MEEEGLRLSLQPSFFYVGVVKGGLMSEVNYRRNGMKYSTTGRCWGMAPKAGGFASDLPAKGPKPKSSRERRAAKKGK